MGLFRNRTTDEGVAIVEGAKVAVTMFRMELDAAADALEAAAYALRDKGGLPHEASRAMAASKRARKATGGD